MILITKPECTQQYHIVSLAGGVPIRTAGRATYNHVEIAHRNFDEPKDQVWERLQHGFNLKLELGEKIESIEFPEDNITLYGVLPVEITQENFEEGCVYKCHIDYFEET